MKERIYIYENLVFIRHTCICIMYVCCLLHVCDGGILLINHKNVGTKNMADKIYLCLHDVGRGM